MKKLNLMLAMMLMFTVAAWAQGGGGGAGGGGAAGGGGQGGSAAGGGSHGSSAAGGVSSNSGAGTTGGQAATSGARTLEGCLIQQGNDFFIQPTKGNKAMVRLVPQNGEDLSAHVGHKVKVHGTREMAANNPNAPVEGKNTNITERDMASAAQGTNVPNSVTTPDQNPPAANDALAGSGALPQGSEVHGNGDFVVSRVDMISDTCNVKGSKHHDKDMNNPSNSTNPPK